MLYAGRGPMNRAELGAAIDRAVVIRHNRILDLERRARAGAWDRAKIMDAARGIGVSDGTARSYTRAVLERLKAPMCLLCGEKARSWAAIDAHVALIHPQYRR